MKLKCTTALILVSCMVFSWVAAAPILSIEARQESHLWPERDFLKTIGILMDGDSILQKNRDEDVSRIEFAIMAARLYNSTYSYSGGNYFIDVSKESVGYKELSFLAERNVVAGSGYGAFEPNRAISIYEAIGIMLNVMGYKNIEGIDYNLYVVQTCLRYNLLPIRIFNNDADLENIINVFYTLLNKNTMNISAIRRMDVVYENSDDTLLRRYFDIHKISGILESNGMVNIHSSNEPSKLNVVVDGLTIKNNGSFPADLIGFNVDVFYRNENDPELVAIYDSGKNEAIRIDADMLIDFSDNTYEYDEGIGKKRSIRIDPSKSVFLYNNELLEQSNSAYLLPKSGYITFVDNNRDGNYEIINIKSYESFVISSIFIKDNITISSKKSLGQSNILIDDKISCIIKDTNGDTLSANELTSGMVVSVAATIYDDKMYAREIVVSYERISGAVDEIINEDGVVKQLVINGIKYEIDEANKEWADGLTPSCEDMVFFANFMGKLVDVEKSGIISEAAVGFLLNFDLSKGISNCVELQIYDELGRIEEYKTATNITIDGVRYKGSQVAYQELQENSPVNSIILFKLDREGYITSIDRSAEYELNMETSLDDRIVKMGNNDGVSSTRGMIYRSASRSFGGRIVLSENALIFVVPEDISTAEEKDFDIIRVNELLPNGYYHIQGYTTDTESPFCNLAVVKRTQTNIDRGSYISVVTKINEAINSNEEITYMVHLQDVNGTHAYTVRKKELIEKAIPDVTTTNNNYFMIEPGDIIRYSVNKDNEIDQLVLSFDYSANSLKTNMLLSPNTYSSSPRTISAIPYDVNSGYIKAVDLSKTDMSNLNVNDFEYFSIARFKKIIEVTKSGNGKITVKDSDGSAVKSYLSYGSQHSKLIINCVDSVERVMVIYNIEQ